MGARVGSCWSVRGWVTRCCRVAGVAGVHQLFTIFHFPTAFFLSGFSVSFLPQMFIRLFGHVIDGRDIISAHFQHFDLIN
jgi:hypothetical protein